MESVFQMILTAMAMYLNIAHGSNFSYFPTFIGDMILCQCVSSSVSNYFKEKKK